MVYGVCRVILRDPHEAEDAAQQTFLSAYDSILKGRPPLDAAPWLATIARNECRARIRKQIPEPLVLVDEADTAPDIATASAQKEEAHALAAAIAELPQHQRQALVLREFYGLSYEEVGAALGISHAAVESLLFRGRQKVQDRLRPFRQAAGALTVPLALRDALAAALPGFAPEAAGAAGGGVAAVVVAKLAAAPAAAKVGAAAVIASAAVGTGAYVGTGDRPAQEAPPAVEVAETAGAPNLPFDPVRASLVPFLAGEDEEEDDEGEDEEAEEEEAEEEEAEDDELEDAHDDERGDEDEDELEADEVEVDELEGD